MSKQTSDHSPDLRYSTEYAISRDRMAYKIFVINKRKHNYDQPTLRPLTIAQDWRDISKEGDGGLSCDTPWL